MSKPILCLDFDGVCHTYTTPWEATEIIPDPPVPGLFEFITEATKHFNVQIFSCRSAIPSGIAAMQEWFWKWGGPNVPVSFPSEKPTAFIGLDDRVLTFTGTWPDMETVLAFKPWNQKERG